VNSKKKEKQKMKQALENKATQDATRKAQLMAYAKEVSMDDIIHEIKEINAEDRRYECWSSEDQTIPRHGPRRYELVNGSVWKGAENSDGIVITEEQPNGAWAASKYWINPGKESPFWEYIEGDSAEDFAIWDLND
jgi:hypothetical protein